MEKERKLSAKVRSSYGPLAYFSDIFISGKNVVFSVNNIFARNENISKNKQADHNMNGLYQ